MTAIDVTPQRALWQSAPWFSTAMRYAVSTAGPLAVSAAHFLASLIFLRVLPAHEFGLFSFVMVVVSFGMSATAALVVVPLTQALVQADGRARITCLKLNWLACGGFGALLFIALAFSGAALPQAAMLGLYGAVFAWRWFARNMAYIDGRIGAAIASDIAYATAMIGTLSAFAFFGHLDFVLGSDLMLLSGLLAIVPFGTSFLGEQADALIRGRLPDYVPIFRDLSCWSLLGVALTEITVNAHAYLVTFIAGPGAFALLALGMLLMRPASLVQSALPDMERPAMARAIAARDYTGLHRIRRHFTYGLVAALLGTLLLVALLLAFEPQLVLKKGYALKDVALVAALSAGIMAIRTWRTPLAVWGQAAGQFKQLAGIGSNSAIVSVIATLALLVTVGPIASLGGIILGEITILIQLTYKSKRWRGAHG